jgi:two-component system response regulator FixJ
LLDSGSDMESGCIVTDIRMPEMDGMELVTELQRRGVRLPVIVLDRAWRCGARGAGDEGGVAAFLEKPFDDEALLRPVRASLAQGEISLNAKGSEPRSWSGWRS